ncbi:MAG TPA: BNR repeat-containing protein [Chitinispirillaceae bacterium]|nr:BNR repeat-containing protein [Chitinispirillaceae bacterium]
MEYYLKSKCQPMVKALFTVCLYCAVVCSFGPSYATAELVQSEKLDIAKVWAGHPVNFAIKTLNNFQCVAYYDTTRKMVIASRTIGSGTWSYTTLRTTPTGWDSHNYIDMAIDDSGYVHVSGDMHNVKLIYFRSKKPWNTSAFDSPGMVGTLENSVTYPVFIKGPSNKLFFQYRDGGSGSGTTLWNSYDLSAKKWSRITEQGLFNGGNQVNAYQTSPVLGPDSFFHVIWMWRDDPNANTNHHLSHIKSKDLIKWQTMAGQNIAPPVTQSTSGVVVDPVQSRRGLINMDFWISWDRKNRAVLTYHRYDNNNISQIFNTRWEENSWKIYQTSTWTDFKWDLERTGSLGHDIAAQPLTVDEKGELVQHYVYRAGPLRCWVLDEESLQQKSDGLYTAPGPKQVLYKVESSFDSMQVNFIQDGDYYIRWETMPINMDQARPNGTYPSSDMLQLYKFTAPTVALKHSTLHQDSPYAIHKASGKIILHFAGTEKGTSYEVALLAINGKIIVRRKTSALSCSIPTSHVRNGVYVLRVAESIDGIAGLPLIEKVVIRK